MGIRITLGPFELELSQDLLGFSILVGAIAAVTITGLVLLH